MASVFMVDDDSLLVTAAARYLRSRGLEVHTATSPFGVSAWIRRYAPDIVVLDLDMPALDGEGLAKVLHGRQDRASPHILFYSGADGADRARAVRGAPGAASVDKADGVHALYAAIVARLSGR